MKFTDLTLNTKHRVPDCANSEKSYGISAELKIIQGNHIAKLIIKKKKTAAT